MPEIDQQFVLLSRLNVSRRIAMEWAALQFGIFFGFADRKPVYSVGRFGPDVPLAKALGSIRTAREPVFFNLDGMRTYWNPAYMPGFPQILPLLEYYAGSRPILCFDQENTLVADMQQLLRPNWTLIYAENADQKKESAKISVGRRPIS